MRPEDVKGKVACIIKEAAGKKRARRRRLWVRIGLPVAAIAAVGIIFAFAAARSFFVTPPDAPQGKITSPPAGSRTGREITLTGFTKNLPIERQYVWLIVDVPDLGLRWPKGPCIKPNTNFRVTIDERGPNRKFRVGLYALGEGMHGMIVEWFKEERLGGLPMFPERYRLDEAGYELSGV